MYGPAGASIPIPTGPALSDEEKRNLILNDPWYKQNTAWLEEESATRKARLERDRQLADQLYNLNVQQASLAANSGGDYGLAAAQAQAGLQKEVAAHDDKLREEQVREIMASRGMFDSGQKQFEQQERVYDYNTLLKGIDIDLQARESAAAQARSEAQSRLALQLQEMQTRHTATLQGFDDDLADLPGQVARERGGYLFGAEDRLRASGKFDRPTMMAVWDPQSGMYRSSDGRYWNPDGTAGSWSPPPQPFSGPAAGTDLGGYVPGSNVVTDYGNTPRVNVPGAGWFAE